MSWILAEVEMDEEPSSASGDRIGQHAIGRRQPDEPIRLVLNERKVDHVSDPTMDELRAALVAVYGTDFGLRRRCGSPGSPTWPARRPSTAGAGSCWPATPPTSTRRWVAKASTSACRTP